LKKLFKELLVFAIIIVVLFGTGMNVVIGGFLQGLILKTGLLDAEVQKNEVVNDFSYSWRLMNKEKEVVKAEEFRNKRIFINLWATWCPPCVAELPDINELYQDVKDENVVFLIISVDESFDKALKFYEKRGFEFPVYHYYSGMPVELAGNSIPRS
jgi:thiol-disulfide isomerase/thioredoxin